MAISNLIPWHKERAVGSPRQWDDPLWPLYREMNRMFEDFSRGFDVVPRSGFGWEDFQPRVDLRETDEAILVTAEMPGLEAKDFDIELSEGMLRLKGEKRHEYEEKEKGRIHRVERSYGSFERVIALPCEVETDKVTAEYQNGLLTVTLPKAPEAKRSVRHIEVTSQ